MTAIALFGALPALLLGLFRRTLVPGALVCLGTLANAWIRSEIVADSVAHPG